MSALTRLQVLNFVLRLCFWVALTEFVVAVVETISVSHFDASKGDYGWWNRFIVAAVPVVVFGFFTPLLARLVVGRSAQVEVVAVRDLKSLLVSSVGLVVFVNALGSVVWLLVCMGYWWRFQQTLFAFSPLFVAQGFGALARCLFGFVLAFGPALCDVGIARHPAGQRTSKGR